MIIGEKSFLKGFLLLISILAAILTLIATILTKEVVFIIGGVVNSAIVWGSDYYLFKKWSEIEK